MQKIIMKNSIAELDGDEMTRILWQMIKDMLILPYIDLNTEYYDLGLKKRDETDDQITVDAANAIARLGVGVKCATITPDAGRVTEYDLKEMWKSPNATLRGILDGTIFRAPIMVRNVKPYVKTWQKPITIARHAYGDIYKASEIKVDKGGKAELTVTDKNGYCTKKLIAEFDKPFIIQGMHNTDESIEKFAQACFKFALATKQDLWFGTKQTISKIYDGRFMDIFNEIYENEYRQAFKDAGIEYFYTLIDDAVARVIRSEGGFIWACKNYDGDVMSDMVSTAFGSLSMMTSVLVSPDGKYEYEAAHGTITRHYYRYLKGEEPTANPIATIFAWTGALGRRGIMDGNKELQRYAELMEKAVITTVENGDMTRDLALLSEKDSEIRILNTKDFMDKIKENFEKEYMEA